MEAASNVDVDGAIRALAGATATAQVPSLVSVDIIVAKVACHWNNHRLISTGGRRVMVSFDDL
jgi:hypothetical protein